MRKRIILSALSVILTAAIGVGSFASVAAQSTTETTEPFTAVSEELSTAVPQETQTVNEEQLEETVEPQQAEPVGAEAEEAVGATYTSGYYEYSVNSSNEATITKYTGSASSVSIPSSLGGYTVNTIGYSAFKDNSILKTVSIPNTVTEIAGDALSGGAFRNCTSLTNVRVPGSVNSIGENTFNGCTSLSTVTIENGVETIRSDAFRNCENITSIFIPKSVKNLGSNVFQDCKRIKTVIIDGGLNLDSNFTAYKAFYKCTALETVTINSGVTFIGAVMFQDCTSLTSVSIPNTVEEIKGDGIAGGAFQNCTSLPTVNIPGSVKTIGYNAFDGCINLTKVTIGNGVETIESKAFYNCENLSSAIIPDSVKNLGSSAFANCKKLQALTIGSGINLDRNYFANKAFCGCSSLETVTINSGITFLGAAMFRDCTSLKSISIPNTVTEIKTDAFSGGAFQNCTSLSSVTIGSSVKMITDNTFRNCSSLKSIIIPNSVTTIDSCAFYECTSLENATIESGTTKIGRSAFYKCSSLTRIDIPESVTQIGSVKQNDSNLKDSNVFYNHSPSLVIYGKTGSFAESFANANGINFNKSQGGTAALANERLTIYQKESGEYKAAQGAKVEYSGRSYTADSYGVVAVPTISSGSITVSKSGYITRTLTSDQLKVSTKIYLEPSNGNAPTVLAVWVGNTDVLHDSYPLEMTSTATTKITAEIDWGNYSYGSIRLSQDGKTASFSGKTLSMVISNKFDTSKDITLIATDSQGRKTEKKLLIENGTVNNTLKSLNGAGFSLDSLSLTLPSGWPFIGGMSLGAGISSIIPVTISADNGKLYIAIGADIGSQSNTDSYATNSETGNRAHVLSNETKSFIQKFKETGVLNSGSAATAAKKLKNFTQTYKDAIKRPQGKFGVEADFTVIGFLEGSYDENGAITWLDSGVIVNPSVSVQHSFPFTLGPVPAFFEVGLSANVLGQLNVRLNEQAKNFVPNGKITGSLSVNGGVGLGVKNVLYVAGGLEGSLCPDWKINFHEKDSLSIKAKLDAYAKLGIAFLEFKNNWTLAETTVYDSSSKSGNSVGALLDDYDIYDYSNYTVKDLSYLDNKSKTNEPVGAVVDDSVGSTQIKNNIYRESTPQLVDFSNGTKLAVWLDSESSNINGVCLYYSYYNGSSWSSPAKVYNDGTLDYVPQMVEANGKAYLVWQNATRTFSGSETLESIAKDFDIAVAVFNGSSFSTTKLSNSNLDMQPVIYAEGNNAYVAWVNNSKNDWFGDNSYNSIYTSTYNGTWSQPQVKYSGLKSIGGLAIDYRNGIRVAYTVDTDGNIQTTDDLRVYENGSRASTNVQSFSPRYYQHKLYWYSGNTFVSSGSSNTGAIPSDRYQLVNANGTMAAVFTQSEGLY